MTDQEKLDALCEIFEREDITPAMSLDSLQWDSMTMMSIMVKARMEGKNLVLADLRRMNTVADILNVL